MLKTNTQEPEKKAPQTGVFLDVHSIFHTIQGEGPFCGVPAVFIRLAGCNLQCPLCDTDYTDGRKELPTGEIVDTALELTALNKTRLVVITGGEPFRQNISNLVFQLLGLDFFVQIETNGTMALPSRFPAMYLEKDISLKEGVYIVVSPKTGTVHPSITEAACAYKYVATMESICEDGLPDKALNHPAHPRLARPPEWFAGSVYLQPVDERDMEKDDANLAACIEACYKHGYTLQLQIHKYIGAP
jgi:organic radical activating enzyme